jgi:two-component system chemotaxis response regulator CheY
MRVLIADDQRSFGTALADMVRYCGHDVVAVVGSGLEAIQAFTLHQPDLVLMDHWMPRLNGVTASRHILAKNPTARVVLLSAWSPLDGADESGAMCFLPKPVDLARLQATLLTISQTLPPPPVSVFEDDFANRPFDEQSARKFATVTPAPIAIPQEIISPVEHFPIDIPVRASASIHHQARPAVAGEGASIAEEKISSSKPRRRKKRIRARSDS